jgi:anti-sigma factor RsiW
MNCPLQTRDHAQQLLDYCSRKLDPQSTAILEQHIAVCPECRDFAAQQRAVWDALDSWEAAPASADFDRKLYARIENDIPWWRSLLRPVTAHWNVAASAAGVFVLLAAGVILNRPAAVAPPKPPEAAQIETVQPEQVEHALDAMDLLAEFDSQVKSAGRGNAKM